MMDPLRRAPTSFKNTFTDDGTVQHNFVSDFSDAKMTPTGNRSYTGRNGVLYASDDDVLPLLLYFRPETRVKYDRWLITMDYASASTAICRARGQDISLCCAERPEEVQKLAGKSQSSGRPVIAAACG